MKVNVKGAIKKEIETHRMLSTTVWESVSGSAATADM